MGYRVVRERTINKQQRTTKDQIITFENFYDIIPEGVKADLLDGKIIRDSPVVPKHGLIKERGLPPWIFPHACRTTLPA